MVPTPAQAATLVQPIMPALFESLHEGLAFAAEIATVPDSHFESHAARYATRNALAVRQEPGVWSLRRNVANSGIHLLFGVHEARVLRSLNGDVPHPGGNKRRRGAWVGVNNGPIQLAFDLDEHLGCSPMSLLFDWHTTTAGAPVVHLSLPVGPWRYEKQPRLYWRVPIDDSSMGNFDDLTFNPSDDGGAPTVTIDDEEFGDEATGTDDR
jgi:hypothetical protein